jgi:acetyl-CoA acetyltransferase
VGLGPDRTPVIAGISLSDYPIAPDLDGVQHHALAFQRVLEDSGVAKADIDGYVSAGGGGGMMIDDAVTMSEYLGIDHRWIDGTMTGGSSFEFHVQHAAAAIRDGRAHTIVVTYGSDQLTKMGRSLGTGQLRQGGRAVPGPNQFEAPFGNSLVGAYAMVAQRHMHEFGTTSEQLAEIAVGVREFANLNPLARYRGEMTVDDVVNSRMQSHWNISECPDFTTSAGARISADVYAEAGLSPADVDVIQFYDSFTITVAVLLEDMGFCKKGEAGAWIQEGHLRRGGRSPLNTDGGGLSSNHPGMRGIFLLIEAARQLRGQGGESQVPDAEVALCAGSGGWLSAIGMVLLGKDRPA